jgi:hypothetical protein
MEMESGFDETEVQPRVQDRGSETGDRTRRDGGSSMPESHPMRRHHRGAHAQSGEPRCSVPAFGGSDLG